MKHLSDFINESASHFLVKQKASKKEYACCPKDKVELQGIIRKRIDEDGFECDLNDIDVSKVSSMFGLFNLSKLFMNFNGDISEWDVSNVKDMSYMFKNCKFNGDISKWDVSNVRAMYSMFESSKFNRDISNWDVSNVKEMENMFQDSIFNNDISHWNTHSLNSYKNIFKNCPLEHHRERQPKFKP